MEMRVNDDFGLRVVVYPDQYQWVASPMPGVHRMMLDRIGDEIARATTIVRYAPNSEFSAHTHGGGEEYFVLDGVFSDENGDYHAGTYVRNPIGSSHSPRIGSQGATIFVKLHQFAMDDSEQKVINSCHGHWHPGSISGLNVMPLHTYSNEHTALVKWSPNTQFNTHSHSGGEEILVLEGTLYDERGMYPKGSWLRSPNFSQHTPFTKDDGATIYVKTGHL
ncbi:MAG: cupin domain-containing protein [Proteobacteria bacterium]|nr:cupin domain-containing protein [Pseudomonadota bacterium]MDA1012404.1 cupin domain-containing protein [Pseudomonadota bacterium]